MKKICNLAGVTILAVFWVFTVSAQTPNLGTASTFAWFTAIGAITNTGTTEIYGDVGTGAGSYTGSPLPVVFGNIHVADAVAAQATVDLQAAYTAMGSLTCDSIIVTPFGNGLVLAPGRIYCITTAAQLQGDLVMDAKGDPSAVFILKINGALSTAVGSGVSLINGANVCNVYWQIGGAVSVAEQATFSGTILADGEITLLNLATLDGRALSRAGAMHLNSNVVIGCDPGGNTLPVTLLNFVAHPAATQVELSWATASETNNSYFAVERSTDAVSFDEIVRIPGAGNSNSVLFYSCSDRYPLSGTSYYRLRQNDFDGKSSYSKTVAVNKNEQARFILYPNPFSTHTTFVLSDNSQTNTVHFELKVYNMMGEEVLKTTLGTQNTTIATNNLPAGTYLYRIISNGKSIQSGRMVAQQ